MSESNQEEMKAKLAEAAAGAGLGNWLTDIVKSQGNFNSIQIVINEAVYARLGLLEKRYAELEAAIAKKREEKE